MSEPEEATEVVSPEPTPSARRRPIILWLLLLVTLYMAGYVVFSQARGYAVVGARHIPLSESFVLGMLRVSHAVLHLTAVIQLFRLRASSTTWLACDLLAGIGLTLIDSFQLIASVERRHTTRLIGFVVAMMVLLLAYTAAWLAYAQRLRRRGMLT